MSTKEVYILRIGSLAKWECVKDDALRKMIPKSWFSENAERIESWLQERGVDCQPTTAPLGCNWFVVFSPTKEVLEVLRKAEIFKPFDIDDTTYPSLEYMEDEPGTRLEPRAFWLMELRRSLQHFYTERSNSQEVLAFHEYLKGETNRVMETIKQSQK